MLVQIIYFAQIVYCVVMQHTEVPFGAIAHTTYLLHFRRGRLSRPSQCLESPLEDTDVAFEYSHTPE